MSFSPEEPEDEDFSLIKTCKILEFLRFLHLIPYVDMECRIYSQFHPETKQLEIGHLKIPNRFARKYFS